MADQIRAYTSTVPAGTSRAAPVTFDLPLPPYRVDAVQFIVPPGVSGLVGFHLAIGGVQVIPYDSDAWIVTADENQSWPLRDFPETGDWQLVAYNTGSLDHDVILRFELSVPALDNAAPAVTLDATTLAPDLAET